MSRQYPGEMMDMCSYFMSAAVRKYPNKNLLRKDRVSFSSKFQVIIHHYGEVKASGTSNIWFCPIHSQEQREMNAFPACLLVCLLVISSIPPPLDSPGPKLREWCHPQWAGSYHLN